MSHLELNLNFRDKGGNVSSWHREGLGRNLWVHGRGDHAAQHIGAVLWRCLPRTCVIFTDQCHLNKCNKGEIKQKETTLRKPCRGWCLCAWDASVSPRHHLWNAL